MRRRVFLMVAALAVGAPQTAIRTVYITVTSPTGGAVADLGPSDFRVREGGVAASLGASAAALAASVATLGPVAATPDGGQLLAGIDEATRTLSRSEASRPMILALTVGGEEHSGLESRDVLERLSRSGTTLYVIAVGNPSDRQRVRIVRRRTCSDPTCTSHRCWETARA